MKWDKNHENTLINPQTNTLCLNWSQKHLMICLDVSFSYFILLQHISLTFQSGIEENYGEIMWKIVKKMKTA